MPHSVLCPFEEKIIKKKKKESLSKFFCMTMHRICHVAEEIQVLKKGIYRNVLLL